MFVCLGGGLYLASGPHLLPSLSAELSQFQGSPYAPFAGLPLLYVSDGNGPLLVLLPVGLLIGQWRSDMKIFKRLLQQQLLP